MEMSVCCCQCGLLKGGKIQEPRKDKFQYLTLANIKTQEARKDIKQSPTLFRSKTHLLGA